MKPTITLNITNLNNSAYTSIILRKFFNMVFVEPDGKTINIYTATIFGGAEKVCTENDTSSALPPTPKYNSSSQCILKFSYAIKDNEIEKICFKDMSSQFIKETNEIKKVWKNVEELQTQEDIKNALIDYYPNIYKPDCDIQLPDKRDLGSVLKLQDGQEKRPSHACIACCGVFQEENESYSYTLATGIAAGIEAINWVRTTIKLKTDILALNQKIEFAVTLDEKCEYYTPDFTWYFAPPMKYVVDSESAMLNVGCQNDEPNKITRVADATTVLFAEWVKKENITERKKSRVNLKDIIAKDAFALSGKTIRVTLSFINPHKHGNMQFFIGLVVAFLLSFCSDKTRLNDFCAICEATICSADKCQSIWGIGQCCCSNFCNFLGIAFPSLIICVFLALTFPQKQCIPNASRGEKIIGVAKIIGVIVTIILIAYIYIGWLIVPKFMGKIIVSCYKNQIIILLLWAISFLFTAVYTLYCILFKKKSIVDFF